MPSPEHILASVFGFSAFRPGQREIVARLLTGTHTLCVMPTGAGKSLCYQVPAIMLDAPTIVVSPLVALMDDQVAGLRANGVAAACIHSGRSRDNNIADWRRVQAGTVKILYLSPERLMTERMLAALTSLHPVMFIIDEAHCISKWGTSFRPEYEALSGLQARFPGATLAAFTATADAATRNDIAAKLFGGRGDIVVHDFDRPNLWLGVTPKTDWRRQLLGFVEMRRGQSGIVYCLSRKLTEEVAGILARENFYALPYHAGLAPQVRTANQEAFMAEEAVVMVATIAFGMGIDKPDIRYVFHLNLPGSIESYYQEIGRAGRDGLPAEVQMLYGLDDIRMRRQFIVQDDANGDHQRREHQRLDALLAYGEASRCRRMALLEYVAQESSPCGNCDVCQDPPVVIDGTAEAQRLLSAITHTRESFGAAHIVDILRGADTEKIRMRGHERLLSFGSGQAHAKPYWLAFIRQAVAGGYLIIDIERYGALKLTDKGRAVMSGEETFYFRSIPPTKATKKAARKAEAVDMNIDAGLLAHLKSLRRELALARGVPAYVVFSDSTLMEMCNVRPDSLETFADISGIGPKKLKDFSAVFLEAIREYKGT